MKGIDHCPVAAAERLKYEAAAELGLLEKLIQVGWSGLSARETGLIGAHVKRGLP